jgi:hypothetical protein
MQKAVALAVPFGLATYGYARVLAYPNKIRLKDDPNRYYKFELSSGLFWDSVKIIEITCANPTPNNWSVSEFPSIRRLEIKHNGKYFMA